MRDHGSWIRTIPSIGIVRIVRNLYENYMILNYIKWKSNEFPVTYIAEQTWQIIKSVNTQTVCKHVWEKMSYAIVLNYINYDRNTYGSTVCTYF